MKRVYEEWKGGACIVHRETDLLSQEEKDMKDGMPKIIDDMQKIKAGTSSDIKKVADAVEKLAKALDKRII